MDYNQMPYLDAWGREKVTKDLRAEEYQAYAKRREQTSLEVLRSMLDSPGYQKLSDEKKAEAISGVLAEQGLTPEEAAAAWGIYGRSGTKEEPYTKSDKKRDLREELNLTTQEVNRLWNLMVKAAERK